MHCQVQHEPILSMLLVLCRNQPLPVHCTQHCFSRSDTRKPPILTTIHTLLRILWQQCAVSESAIGLMGG
jgi:hypothetical protein